MMKPSTLKTPSIEPETPKRFAFLIHPRVNVQEDMGKIHPWLGIIPTSWYEKLFRTFPVKPRVFNKILMPGTTDQILGECIIVPLSPAQLLGRDRALVNKRIDQAIEFAKSRGATIIGLGALTAPATSGGKKLQGRTDVGVTNGNAFTAAATFNAIKNVVSGINGPVTVALVGATGSVGAAVAETVAAAGIATELILVGRNKNKLTQLAAGMPQQPVRTSVDINDCIDADLIVLMTSATETLLKSEHLKPNAIVIDDTQPRNTTPDLLVQRPDITLIDGGIVLTPGLKRIGSAMDMPANTSFACLAETALLTLNDHEGHGIIGNPTLSQVNLMQSMADKYSEIGFYLAPPTCFGEPITVPGWVDREVAA